MQEIKLNTSYVPSYHYTLEKDGEEYEFGSYQDMIGEVQQWDDVVEQIYEAEKDLEEGFFSADADHERDMWISDVIEELLDNAGYAITKVLR